MISLRLSFCVKMNDMSVDVIIPTYKPNKEFFSLIEALEKQTVKPENIWLMNTEEKYLNNLLYGTSFKEKYGNIHIKNISHREFNHGRTRNAGAKKSKSSVMVFMTQDAYPADEFLIEELLKALEDKEVAAAYARQIPRLDASTMEKYSRSFNYPEQGYVKSKQDISKMGVKTYFCSNSCAAYKKDIFLELGGFVNFTIFNEDMLYAAKAINTGYKIAYAAKAKVIHSHNYTAVQQFKRNFDLGVSQSDHQEVFGEIKSESEGIRLVKNTARYLIRHKKAYQLPYLIYVSGCKFLGYKLGRNYQKLSKKMILACSMSGKVYWNQYWDKKEIPENVYAGYGKTEAEEYKHHSQKISK